MLIVGVQFFLRHSVQFLRSNACHSGIQIFFRYLLTFFFAAMFAVAQSASQSECRSWCRSRSVIDAKSHAHPSLPRVHPQRRARPNDGAFSNILLRVVCNVCPTADLASTDGDGRLERDRQLLRLKSNSLVVRKHTRKRYMPPDKLLFFSRIFSCDLL